MAIRINDPKKVKSNLIKHGVSFEEAVTALYDPMALVLEDKDSIDENHWIFIGLSAQTNLLTVGYIF